MSVRLKRFVRRQDGAVALEFAIVATLFIFLSLAVIDFARNFYNQHRMAHVADHLARRVYLKPDITATELATILPTLAPAGVTLTVERATENSVPVVILTLVQDQDYISPGLSDLDGRIRIVRKVPIVGSYF